MSIRDCVDGTQVGIWHNFIINQVKIGSLDITMENFSAIVRYILTNTDLNLPNDPRIILLKELKKARITKGYNKGGKRIQL